MARRPPPAAPPPPHGTSSGEPPPWPPIRPVAGSGPRRDRRKPLRPRQIILAVLVALGVGALLGSGALVGLAERQPLSTQRDVALGAAKVADRVAHLLSLNRPATELAAALDGTEEVYDVEALIARARAAAPAAPEPPPETDGEREPEPTVTVDTLAEPDESDPSAGPPQDGIVMQAEGIDCVPEEDIAVQPSTDDKNGPLDQEDGHGDPEPTGGTTGSAERDADAGAPAGGSPASDVAEQPQDGAADTAASAADPTGTADDGRLSDDPQDPAVSDEFPEGVGSIDPTEVRRVGDLDGAEPEGDEPGGSTSGSGIEPVDPTVCPPGYVPADLAEEPEPSPDATGPQDADPTAAETMAEDGITEPPLFDAPRVPDEDHRLQMYIGGDSISRDLGEGLARVTPAALVRIDLDPRPATGLSRPDFFDWSQHLAGVLTESLPDVIVVLFGANDFQNVEYEGEVLDRFGDDWLDLYRRRVDRIMALLGQPDVQTVWVGQPPVRESRLSGGLARMNAVYEEVAAEHPQVTYVDTWALFSDTEGGYADEIGGVRLRRADGVHLTIAGGNRLAEAVWGVIGPAWGLDG